LTRAIIDFKNASLSFLLLKLCVCNLFRDANNSFN